MSTYQYKDLLLKDIDPYANAKYDIIRNYLKGKKLNILNAGCGTGELAVLLAKDGHKVLGIDREPEYIRIAKQAKEVSYKTSSIEEFEGEFDCVISNDVLEHIEDDKTAIRKLEDMVKPGGYLILTVPALQSLYGFHDVELGHYRRYSAPQLKKMIKGFSIKTRYFGFTLIPVCILFSKILKRAYPISSHGQGILLKFLLRMEKIIAAPLGTSLMLFGRKHNYELTGTSCV